MKITIDIPDRDWAVMVERAESHGLRVSELVRMAVYDSIPKGRTFQENVLQLVRAGYPDARIAERYNVPNATIARIRQRAKLPANRFTRTETPTPTNVGVSYSEKEAA